MAQDEFDASETIAGFTLPKIKGALPWVGMAGDRHVIKDVSKALGCSLRQAAQVLEGLERRGLVKKSGERWDKTALGHRLAYDWHPPRRIQQAVERESPPSVINEMFQPAAKCSIWRSMPDDSVGLEEAEIEAGVWVKYEGDSLVVVTVFQPDDYDDPESSNIVETEVYLSPRDAKVLVKALAKAIPRAEAEIKRRAKEDSMSATRPVARSKRRAGKTVAAKGGSGKGAAAARLRP